MHVYASRSQAVEREIFINVWIIEELKVLNVHFLGEELLFLLLDLFRLHLVLYLKFHLACKIVNVFRIFQNFLVYRIGL